MPCRSLSVPEDTDVQVEPPSPVRNTSPPSPTAMQLPSVGQLTPCRSEPVPERANVQFVPSAVETTLPNAPTATQWVVAEQLTLSRSLPWGAGLSQCAEPSLRRGPTSPLAGSEPGPGTAAAIGGQTTVKTSSQPNARKPESVAPFPAA